MDLEQFKDGQRQMWETGDYRQIGRVLEPAARNLVARAGVSPNNEVLDIGVGSGNVTLAAVETGADVIGIDITDAWWDEAYRRAQETGYELDLRIGDVEGLGFEDETFDIVLSSFASIFAPRHDVVASELNRVCRSGGLIGINSWPPGDKMQNVMNTLFERLPPGPKLFDTSIDWGNPDYVTERFAPYDLDLEFTMSELPVEFPSAEEHASWMFENSGGFMAAKAELIEMGDWDDAYNDFIARLSALNESDDGFLATWTYLTVLARKG